MHTLKPALVSDTSTSSPPTVRETVEQVIADVRQRGDAAVREYAERFDRYAPESFRLTSAQIEEAIKNSQGSGAEFKKKLLARKAGTINE